MSIVLQNIDFMPPAVCKVFLTMFAQPQRLPPVEEAGASAPEGWLGLKFAEKRKDSFCMEQPLCRASRGTSPYTGEVPECAAGC